MSESIAEGFKFPTYTEYSGSTLELAIILLHRVEYERTERARARATMLHVEWRAGGQGSHVTTLGV